MNIYYLNDESETVTIMLVSKDPKVNNTYSELKPQEGKMFTFDAPENSIPFVKRWNNRMILLSYMDSPPSVRI